MSNSNLITGTARKFGDNIDTDAIIPARYLNAPDTASLAAHCMEDADVNFAKTVQKGDIITSGRNFGCGSSREHAPVAIKACGVSCVIACSFARIFYRNAVNTGLSVLECADAASINAGDTLEIDLQKGEIKNITQDAVYKIIPPAPFINEIIECGGLIEYTKRKMLNQ